MPPENGSTKKVSKIATAEASQLLYVQELITLHSDGKKVVTPAGSDSNLVRLKSNSKALVMNIVPHVDRDVVAIYTSEVLGTKKVVEGKEVIAPLTQEKTIDKVYWLNGKYVDPTDVPLDYPDRAGMLQVLYEVGGHKLLKSRDGKFHCVEQKSNLILDVPVGVAAV